MDNFNNKNNINISFKPEESMDYGSTINNNKDFILIGVDNRSEQEHCFQKISDDKKKIHLIDLSSFVLKILKIILMNC